MTDTTLESSAWPVNQSGEVVASPGTGNRNIVAYLPTSLVPVGSDGAFRLRLPDYLQQGTVLSDPYYKLISSVNDLPAGVAGVIQLEDNVTYVVTTDVDLEGQRLVGGRNTTILGGSSELSFLRSTGLNAPLITSEWSLPIRGITLASNLIFNLDAQANPNQALDWFGVNFVGEVGRIANYNNFVATDCALLEAYGMEFDGTTGTIAFNSSLFNGVAGETIISVPATAVIQRRIRFSLCAFVSLSGETSINVSASANIPVEGFILTECNFSGGGTYLGGIDHTTEKSLFTACRGIVNTGSLGHIYMQGNVTVTDIVTQGVFVKVAGTTSMGPFVEKFSASNNRLTYTGALTGYFKATAICSANSGNNQLLTFRLAKNDTTTPSSESRVNTSGNGRTENVKVQDIFSLVTGDYIEVFVANGSSDTDITVTDYSLIIERLN